MYTSYIGKKFLTLYNEKEGKNLTAKEFFEEIFFELFFEDESHLMHVGNSPFFQKPKSEDVEKHGSKSLAQLNNLQTNIENDEPNMAIFVGFAAKDLQGTTSGQLTSMDFKIDEEEMYASWFGEALSMGVSGGYLMAIDEPKVLLTLYEGWKYYRKYLQQTPNVKDKQIETWNGHWLTHCFDKNYNENDPFENFQVETVNTLGKIAIPTNDWSKVIFALSKKYPNQTITAYCYNLSQTNTTLGFINLFLPEVRKMYQFRDAIFINEKGSVLEYEQIEKLQTFYGFKNACQLGTIGLKALEPANLRTYMPKGSVMYAQGKDFKFNNEQSFLDYQLYKLWITAMLNKTELLNLAADVAKALIEFEKGDERGKKIYSTISQNIKDSKNIKSFIDSITIMLEKEAVNGDIFKDVVTQVLKMPADNFPLFSTLIRFEYQYQKIQK